MTDVWAPAIDAAAFARVAAALVAGESEHLPTVLDLTVLGERRELLVGGIGGPTLASLLQRRRLSPGEGVTVVVSIARAVAALHAAGYCGADLAGDGVRFDAAGRPVLVGVEDVRETIQAGSEGRADDWRALAALAEHVGLLGQPRSGALLGAQRGALGLAFAALGAADSAEHLVQLEDALFDVAAPAPVCLDAPAGTAVAGPPRVAQQPPVSQHQTERAATRTRALHRRPSASALVEAFDAGPAALLTGPMKRLGAAAATARSRVQGRARLAVFGGAAAAALTVALVLLLPAKPSAEPGHQRPTAARSAAGPDGAAAPSAGPRGQADAPEKETPENKSRASTDEAALVAADPVAAASVLIARRDACLAGAHDALTGCLATVADGGASALDQPARPLGGLTPSLLERSGDSALIALTPKDPKTAPASALLMRTGAGWRLRQLYEN